MKSITTTNTIVTTSTTALLVLLLSSLGAHLGHAFPSSSSSQSRVKVVEKSTSFGENVPPSSITSSEKPGLISHNNPTSSRGIEEIPSQSKSESISNKWKWLSPPRTSAPPPPQQDSHLTYYYSYQENKNYSQAGVQLSPTQPNGKRQIGNSSGNPISLDLHDKVNVEWEEEVKVGGRRDGARVTDVNPKFGFQAGSEASIHLQTEEDDTIPNPDTVTLLLPKKKNVNVDPFIFIANNNVRKPYSSVSIKNTAVPGKGEDGESSTTQFSSKDNSKNETETNRTYIHPWDGPGQNSKVGNTTSNGEIQSDDVENIRTETTAVAAAEDDGVTKKQRLVSKYRQRNVDLYFTPVMTGSETKTETPPSCLPIVVNQTFTVRKYGETRTPTLDPDMDKWTSLVKMSQCVATCIGRLPFSQKYNMSPRKKGINEGGGFPVRIAAPLPSPNYNGDITSSHFDDKLLLSSCQKSCNFLPEKSSNSPISIARNWKEEAEEETNKVNDPAVVGAEDASSKRVVGGGGDVSNHGVGVKVRGKNDKNSSAQVDAKRKIIATTATQFHLHWPKVISLASSTSSSSIIKNKSPVILYNVMVLEQGKDEATLQQQQQRLLPPRWKLIDQTVQTQTQISLLTWHGPCSRLKPKSHHHSGSPHETIILDELHDHLVQQHEPILVKVVAIGSQGVEKVFSGLIILTSATPTTSQSEDEDKSKPTLESTCCQSSINVAEMQHLYKKVGGISNPQRNSDATLSTRAIILMSQENKNSNNTSFSPDESGRSLFVAGGGSNNSPSKQRQQPPPNLSASETLVIPNEDKNSAEDIIASNKINFKESSTRTWSGSNNKTRTGGRTREEVSYKVESDPNTGGQIDTDNNSNEVKDKEEDANRKSTTASGPPPSFQRHDSLRGGSNPVLSPKTTFTTKSQQQFIERNRSISSKKLVQPPTTITSQDDVDDEKNDAKKDDWGLRAVSMVYQNFLVVTEVRWNVPGGSVANQEEDKKNASSDKNNNSATAKSSNLVTEPESGGESVGKEEGTRYQFLLTWEILGGGLKGNLVTDIAGGTINLWPETAYFIQVGLLDPETPSSSSEGKPPSSTSSSEQEQHQNYMSNLLGMESIIFPLADSGTGQPKLTSTSQPLLVNTSSVATSEKLSIPAKSSSPSPSLSQRSRNLLLLPKRNDDKTRHKSNNLPLNGEEKSSRGKYLPRTYRYNNEPSSKVKEVAVDKEKADSVLNGNVRPITIPGGGTVSTNGNDHSHLTKNKNVRPPSSSSSSSSSLDEVGDHHSATVQQPLLDLLLQQNKKYYQKNYNGGPSDNGSPSSSSHYGMMGDSPGGKSLLVRGNNDKLLEGDDEKLFHGHPHHRPQYRNHYLVGTAGNQKSATTNSTTTNDKTANINDNKSNNLEKERNIKKKANGGGGAEHRRNAAADTHLGAAYRPEGYQGLFALNLGLGGYNYNYDHNEDGETTENESNKFGNGTNSGSRSGDTGASVIYSIFVLVVVACVIFLFLVAFIGFFVVTSSITHTAHYFIPKRLRIWVVGGNSESELLAGNEQDAENEDEAGFVDGRFVEDLDDDVPEWGDDVGGGGGGGREGQHHHHLTQQDVLMTHRDIGRT